jgi:hypothetical protein
MNTQMWTSDDEIFSSSKPQVSLPNDEFEDLLSSVFDGPEGEAFMGFEDSLVPDDFPSDVKAEPSVLPSSYLVHEMKNSDSLFDDFVVPEIAPEPTYYPQPVHQQPMYYPAHPQQPMYYSAHPQQLQTQASTGIHMPALPMLSFPEENTNSPTLDGGQGADCTDLDDSLPNRLRLMPWNQIQQRAEALLRFREKKARRCFNKKIRYESRKAYADVRPRYKGRFVSKEEYERLVSEDAAREASGLGTDPNVQLGNFPASGSNVTAVPVNKGGVQKVRGARN